MIINEYLIKSKWCIFFFHSLQKKCVIINCSELAVHLCLCVCVIRAKSVAGDTYCSGTWHEISFEYFGRCSYVWLWTDFANTMAAQPDTVTKVWMSVADMKVKVIFEYVVWYPHIWSLHKW